ncbi:hypothetical protein [Rubrivirga sp.]|uniref:hypothetical protein n=1 Tax=Rubrivirga sp. TaxID=1885344 RepID=UPI003C70B561
MPAHNVIPSLSRDLDAPRPTAPSPSDLEVGASPFALEADSGTGVTSRTVARPRTAGARRDPSTPLRSALDNVVGGRGVPRSTSKSRTRLRSALERARSSSRTLLVALGVVLVALAPATEAQVNQSGVFINSTPGVREARTDLNANGNQVESIVTNTGAIGRGNESINQAGVWPKGTGHGHLHQMSGLVAAQVPNQAGTPTVIVSDGYSDANSGPLAETDGRVEWKFQPKPGYFNPQLASPEIANSLNPGSWPRTWPGRPAEWDGLWNGFFGLNQFNADQEIFYVMDDWTNREFQVFPFGPGQPDLRGLGVQIDVRLFQWSQALAKDILFMQYAVSNAGQIDYTNRLDQNPMFFGGYTDTNPAGSGASDDGAAFSQPVDLVYGFSTTGIGTWVQFPEIPPGYVGWKFLESPSISFDGIDNDDDGLTDESRDNDAGAFIFGSCGVYGPPQDHWEGDEDCDWIEEIDDKGTDGIGPEEEGYPGPDDDGTEGNGRPDQGEPNFGQLDKDESDQVGLTSFNAPLFGVVDVKDEPAVWRRLQPGFFDVPQQGVNQIWIFGSGPFGLAPGRTERFSTAFLWGANEQAMFRTAQVAQRIFDADYRFARPPRQPKVSVVPGDGKVTLLWDDLAELSRDPIYGRDFEGYRILKSTDPQFRDAQDITDALGNDVYKRSIAQFDLVNGLTGPHPLQFGEEIGLPNGVHFYMGEDTGLQRAYVDEDVVNGRTYYYAVLAYDAGYDLDFFERGITEIDNLFPISPAESPASITVTNGVITNFDQNTVQATPNPPPSDTEPGTVEAGPQGQIARTTGAATGTVRVIPLSGDLLRSTTYTVSFTSRPDGSAVDRRTSTFSVVDAEGRVIVDDQPVPTTFEGVPLNVWTYEVLDEGFTLAFENANPTEASVQQASGWTRESQTNLLTTLNTTPAFGFDQAPLWAINAAIEVTADTSGSVFTSLSGRSSREVFLRIVDTDTGDPIDAVFTEPRDTRDGRIQTGESITLAFLNEETDSRFSQAWTIRFEPPLANDGSVLPESQWVLPQPGDRYLIRSPIPFTEADAFAFASTAAQRLDNADESILDRVRVVPNPYVVGNAAETRPFLSGRGERKIFFRNLPGATRVRIYTVAGVFVRELEGVDGVATWDLRTKDGLEAAFGLYFYHVEAEGIGESVGRFAIIN